MNFEKLAAFQDSLIDHGVGGNDTAIFVDGVPVYRHFAGYQNVEEQIPITEKTVYRMFSMTKIITCAAALQLFEQGKFLLTEPVSKYLPEFDDVQVRIPKYGLMTQKPRNPILIRHLFTMTSGIDYSFDTPEIKALAAETDNHFTTRQLVQAVAKNPLYYEPGERYMYGLNHDVLGALIEVWSGQTFADYCRDHIFEPLGMTTACFRESEIDQSRLCRRYAEDPESGKPVRSIEINDMQPSDHYFSGGAGTTMSIDDYAKFACTMTNRGISREGVRILSGRTVDMMRANHLTADQLRSYQSLGPLQEGCGYGLGVNTVIDPALASCTMGQGAFSWSGAWGTHVVMDPLNKVTFIWGVAGYATPLEFVRKQLNMAYAALERQGLI